MDFQANRCEITVHETLYADLIPLQVEGDSIVPDKQEDIGQILQMDAVTAIESREVSNGKVTLYGCVYLTILYTPAGEQGGVDVIRTSFPYQHVIKVEGEHLTVCAESSVGGVTHHLYNPRKLNTKVEVLLDVQVLGKRSVEAVTDCIADGGVETRTKQVQGVTALCHAWDVIGIKEAFDVPGSMPAIERILQCDLHLNQKEYKILKEKMVLKGEIGISTLYLSESGTLEMMEHALPFTEIVDVDALEEDMEPEVSLALSNIHGEATENMDGDWRVLYLEAKLYVQIFVCRKEEISVLSDAFCTEFPLQLEQDQVSYTCRSPLVTEQLPLREVLTVTEELPRMAQVYRLIATPRVQNTDVENGKMKVEGVVECTVFYLGEDPDRSPCTMQRKLPFSHAMEVPLGFEEGRCEMRVHVEHKSYTLSANGIEVRCLLTVEGSMLRTHTMEYIRQITPGESDEQEARPALVIYFAQKEDDLWNIAKTYSVTRESILKANSLTDEVIQEGQKLIIPR